jgi:hypothetical protein
MTKEEAIKIALNLRPDRKVIKVTELEKCFVVSTVPKAFDENSGDLYIGGGIRVDKKTGKTSLYNPMLEKMR